MEKNTEKYLFITRTPSGEEICTKELPVVSNLFSMAHTFMDVVRLEYRDMFCDHCEIWQKLDDRNMTLLITVF